MVMTKTRPRSSHDCAVSKDIDILTQISASNSALKSVALLLLDDHLNHCVRQASIQGGEVADEKLAEASAAIARLVKS